MPLIKTKRKDILRQKEIIGYLDKAETVAIWLPCMLAILWMFGKRISEICTIEREHIYTRKGYLYIRFFVLKKKNRKDAGVPKMFLKRITLKHAGVQYVLRYVESINAGAIFPNMYREKARYYLRKLTEKAWFHLFRESLATEMAENGASEEQLMHWFDWDRVETAHKYVKRGTKLTEQLSDRTY